MQHHFTNCVPILIDGHILGRFSFWHHIILCLPMSIELVRQASKCASHLCMFRVVRDACVKLEEEADGQSVPVCFLSTRSSIKDVNVISQLLSGNF
jgi:hypothetical protein